MPIISCSNIYYLLLDKNANNWDEFYEGVDMSYVNCYHLTAKKIIC